MDEYISKQLLIRMFNAKADMALGTPKVAFSAAAKMVEKLPAADVVSVVRCRNCIHGEAGKIIAERLLLETQEALKEMVGEDE